MSDLIDRQAAIDALEEIDCTDGVGISSLKCDAVDDAVTAIKALPSAQPVEDIHREKEQAYYCGYEDGAKAARSAQPRWIPCSEGYPEHRVYVLVAYKPVYGIPDIGITWYSKSEGKWNTSREVLAWMPLPKPYEGERDDNT